VNGGKQRPKVNPMLTPLEASVLAYAAAAIAEDIDSYGLSPQERRAYWAALKKLRAAARSPRYTPPT
jgi:hypothetical protein